MRAITVRPGVKNSARLDEVEEPALSDGALLVRALALGICGTDREIIAAQHGSAPPGEERLILGHESLGVVEEAPAGSGFKRGDHVVGIVRRPDPDPCPACAAGEWDMCRNGGYTERGIKAQHGFGAERFRLEPGFAVEVDPRLGLSGVLMEPTSVVAKAWDHAAHIARRAASSQLRTLLVTGTGPIGFLAALLGRLRGLDVHIFGRAESGPRLDLTRDLGGTYHRGSLPEVLRQVKPDILMECTGAPAIIGAAVGSVARNGIVCLLGLSAAGSETAIDLGQVNSNIVLQNQVVFGSVNANRNHYEDAAAALASADKAWLARLINRRVPLAQWHEALENQPDDIKVVIDFTL